jgi:site-specific DNA-methyltransferase (adenine-specific)
VERVGEIALRNQIYCADNRTILLQIPADSIDLILTDPPYKDYRSNRPVVHSKQKAIKQGDFDLVFFVEQSFRILKPGAHFYCFCDHNSFADIKSAVEKRFRYKNCLVWVKNNHGSGDLRGEWAPQHEWIIFTVKGKGHRLNPPRPANVLHFPKVHNEKFNHGTVKPLPLLKRIIEASTSPGDLVLDPYAGVMSTALACIESGRNYLMIEKERSFYEQGLKRIKSILEL